MLKQILTGAGIRTAVGAAGGALSSAVGALSGIGTAFGTLANAAGAAANASKQNTSASGSNVIYVNFGMAGTAGKQKISGGGNLPIKQATAKPQVSEKMPTEALLNTAVKYLTSIDKTLRTQLDFERRNYEQQTRDAREAIVENKSSFNFSDIKEKLSGLKSNVKDNASFAMQMAKYAAGLGLAAAAIASSLDQEQLNALKENVDRFKENFGWLGEAGGAIGAAGLAGFLFGGKGVTGRLKGGLVAMVAANVLDTILPVITGGAIGGTGTGVQTDAQGNPVASPAGESGGRSNRLNPIGYALAAAGIGIGIMGVREGLKDYKPMSNRLAGTARSAIVRSSTVPQMQAAARTGTSWLKSRRGRIFLVILGRKLGRGLVARIFRVLARIVAGLLVTATGVGAIPGIAMILLNVAFIGYEVFIIARSIWEAWTESAADAAVPDVAPSALPTESSIAGGGVAVAGTPVGGGGMVAAPSAGNATASGPVTNDRILRTIRMMETRNRYNITSYAEGRGSSASGAYQFQDGVWQNLTREFGIGTEYSRAMHAPPHIQDQVADRQVTKYLQQANGDVSKIPLAWYTGNIRGESKVVSRETLAAYQAKWMRVFNGADPDDLSKMYDPARADSPGGYVSTATGGHVGAGIEATSTGAPVSSGLGLESAINMFTSLAGAAIEPGSSRRETPLSPNVSERINTESMRVQNDLTFGIRRERSRENITSPTVPAVGPGVPQPTRSISSMDPNYGNNDSIVRYLAHYRLAA